MNNKRKKKMKMRKRKRKRKRRGKGKGNIVSITRSPWATPFKTVKTF